MYEEVIWRSNWQPCQFNQSSDISSSSDSVASSSCCIFSSGTSSASSFSASSCFSSSCYFQIHVCGGLNGSQIFTEHVSKGLCRTRDLGSIQQVASNATIRKKSYGGHLQKPNRWGRHAAGDWQHGRFCAMVCLVYLSATLSPSFGGREQHYQAKQCLTSTQSGTAFTIPWTSRRSKPWTHRKPKTEDNRACSCCRAESRACFGNVEVGGSEVAAMVPS